jgi:hypothetical protein
MLVLKKKKVAYTDGGEGFLQWARDKVKRFDRACNGWVPFEPTRMQEQTFRECLKMENGLFKYQTIVFCRPRGEFKSYDVCLIVLWRFCNFPREKIILGANSKEQVNYVHFQVIKDTILNSPEILEMVGEENVLEKSIYIREQRTGKQKVINAKDIISSIIPVGATNGIFSNLTICTFSELWKMKDEKFFTELSSSARSTPNALTLIDSTVAPKGHILRRMFDTYVEKKDDLLFFQHYEDTYYNPYTTDAQLNSFRQRFLPSEFNKFFRNRWEDAGSGTFNEKHIAAMAILGAEDTFQKPQEVMALVNEKYKEFIDMTTSERAKMGITSFDVPHKLSINKVYHMQGGMPELLELQRVTGIKEWILTMGLDRAQPGSQEANRTFVSTILKGKIPNEPDEKRAWMYFMLRLLWVESSDIREILGEIEYVCENLGIPDNIALESYMAADVKVILDEREIPNELVHPNYNHQLEAFTMMYQILENGYFKCPMVPYYRNRGTDQLVRGQAPDGVPDMYQEELLIFEHDFDARAFGSPYKLKRKVKKSAENEESGSSYVDRVLDDSVFGGSWGVWASRFIWVGSERFGIVDESFGQLFRMDTLTNTFGLVSLNQNEDGIWAR